MNELWKALHKQGTLLHNLLVNFGEVAAFTADYHFRLANYFGKVGGQLPRGSAAEALEKIPGRRFVPLLPALPREVPSDKN